MQSVLILDDGSQLASVKQVTFKESVIADEEIRPGTVCSASIEVEAFGTKDRAIEAGESLFYYRDESLIGRFTAEPSIATKRSYKFTAYDNASKLDADFSAWLLEHQGNFPMTVSDLITAACTVANVSVSGDIPFATYPIQAFYADSLTCRDIFSYVAELGCRFVRCNSGGDLVFQWFEENTAYSIFPSAEKKRVYLYDDDTEKAYAVGSRNGEIYYEDVEYYTSEDRESPHIADDTTGTVYRLSIKDEEMYYEAETGETTTLTVADDANGLSYKIGINNGEVYYEETSSQTVKKNIAYKQDGLEYSNYLISPPDRVAVHPVGEDEVAYIYPAIGGDNILHISANLLLTGASDSFFTTVAETIYNGVSSIGSYRSMDAKLFPMECPFRAGEIVDVTDSQGVSFKAPVTQFTVSQNNAILSSVGSERYSAPMGNTQKAITQLASDIVRINKLKVAWAEINEAVIHVLETEDLTADWIKAGILQSQNGSFYLNLDSGELNLDASVLKINGEDMSLVIQGYTADIQDSLDDLRAHIVIGNDGSMKFIGAQGNPITLRLVNDQLSIYNGDDLIDTFAANGTTTQNLTIPQGGSFTMGGFKWVPRSSGSLDLMWVGG